MAAGIAGPQPLSSRAGRTALVLDPDVIAQLRQWQSMGKGDFVRKVFGLYQEHAPAAVDRIRQAAASNEIDACSNAAHALKSMSLNIGARRVVELSLSVETAAKTHNTVPSDADIEDLRQALADALRTLGDIDGL